MSDNLNLWNAVARVPPEHLKGFTRGGGFKGTAIKPMWSIKAMTEHFGPCGQGWGVQEPKFTIHPAGAETLVFCTVGVWYKDNTAPVYGVGGDKVVAQFSSGLKPDDEAFKKAYTDALTNALKLLGVGADIHMGLWDGNKYVDEGGGGVIGGAQHTNNPMDKSAIAIGLLPSAHNNSKTASRDDFQRLCSDLRNTATLKALETWAAESAAEIAAMNEDFQLELRNSYKDHMNELKGRLAA